MTVPRTLVARTFSSGSSLTAEAEEAGAVGTHGLPGTGAQGARALAWDMTLPTGLLGAGSWGTAGACERMAVALPSSLKLPSLLSLGTSVAIGWRSAQLVVVVVGLVPREVRSRGAGCRTQGAVSQRRQLKFLIAFLW